MVIHNSIITTNKIKLLPTEEENHGLKHNQSHSILVTLIFTLTILIVQVAIIAIVVMDIAVHVIVVIIINLVTSVVTHIHVVMVVQDFIVVVVGFYLAAQIFNV